jgi:hypothetical protein
MHYTTFREPNVHVSVSGAMCAIHNYKHWDENSELIYRAECAIREYQDQDDEPNKGFKDG